jgi:hypothetical protein
LDNSARSHFSFNKEDVPVSKTDVTLSSIEFGSADLRTIEEISQQVAACRTASEKSGRPAHVLAVFLKMVDEKLTTFVKDLRERLKTPRTA